MFRGASSTIPESPSDASEPGSLSQHSLTTRIARIGCVVVAGLFVANCANNQVAGRGKSKEIGAFPQSKYGPASPRVIAEGQDVPKGGGRQLIGKTYSVAGKRYTPYEKPVGYTAIGTASWYGEAFHGRRTANGEIYDRNGISAAHPTMPLPAYARVTNMLNNRSIIVRVNDRGPYHGGRVMDVSQKTADALAFRHLGTARIKLEYLGQASLAGSDDNLLLATLRTDGQPAAIPGTSAPTMVASAGAVASSRYASANLDEAEPVRQDAPRQESARQESARQESARQDYSRQDYARQDFARQDSGRQDSGRQDAVRQPVAQAYAAEPVRMIAPTTPVAAALVSTAPAAATVSGVPVRGAPMPPSRPFDLETIAGAGTPVTVRPLISTARPPVRTTTASLFAAPERSPTERFAKTNPLVRDLAPQTLQPLSRN